LKLRTVIAYRLRFYIPHRSKVKRACLRKQWKVFYPSSSDNHGYQDILEENKWENVKNVEQLFLRLGRNGQWPGAHLKLEKELS
jgi:hypothetical protein